MEKNVIEIKEEFKCNIGILRIVACLMVICSHLICLVIFDPDYEQHDLANLLYIIRSSCVPLFLCITGILSLKKRQNFKKCIINFARFLCLYAFFVIIYQILKDYNQYGYLKRNFIIEAFKNPQGHLWYLPLIAQIYFFMPILKLISENKNAMKLYLSFWVIVEIVFPLGEEIFTQMGGDIATNLLLNNISLIKQSDLFLYSGYVLLGYYLYYQSKCQLDIEFIWMIYFAIICVSFVYSKIYFAYFGNFCNNVWNYNSLTALGETTCLVLVTKIGEKIKYSNKTTRIIKNVSKDVFGIYLTHAIFTEKLFGFMTSRSLIITVPICILITFICSWIIILLYDFGKYNFKNICKIIKGEKNGNKKE